MLRRGLGATRRAFSTFYDSQSGRQVTLPSGPQCHLGLTTVPIDRVSSAMAHLKKNGELVKGLASVLTATAVDEAAVAAAAQSGHTDICVEVSSSLADSIFIRT